MKRGIQLNKVIKFVMACSMFATLFLICGCTSNKATEVSSIASVSSAISTNSVLSITSDAAIAYLTKALDEQGIKSEIVIDKETSTLLAAIHPMSAEKAKYFEGYEDWSKTKKDEVRKSLDWDNVTESTLAFNDVLYKTAKELGLEGSFLIVASDDSEYIFMTFTNDKLDYDILA